MRFSVIIPTYNREEKLAECLKALFNQDFDKTQYEILVVDDGSQDGTQRALKRFLKESPVPFYSFFQLNQGQGAARNKGITEAKGEIVLFLGDDIVAAPELLKEHDKLHKWYPEENAAVLGFVTWHPKLNITSLMRFMERGGAIFGRFGGHQFAYDLLKGRRVADYRFFYTSNISLKRGLLQRFRFDPWFSGYGWEDIELGYRLTKKADLILYYAPQASAYHDHAVNEEQWVERMRNIGESSHLINQKYPELNKVPSRRKELIFRILSHPLSLAFLRCISRNLYFYALSKKYFLEGLRRGYNRFATY